MSISKRLVAALALPLVALAGIAAFGAVRWTASTRELMARLEAARQPLPATGVDWRELGSLPAPVQRYFRAVLREGAPVVATARVAHAGTFNLGETTDRWRPFTSTQRVVMQRPGFVWDGRVSMLPGVDVRVHDAYVAGEGILHPALLGAISLADLRGRGEIARGELMRFFAEAAWYLTALLPSQGVRWEPLDDHAARATLVDGPITLSLTFRFGPDGLIETVRAEARGRTVAGEVVPTPWEGRWSDYRWRDGMRVPMRGEVAWLLPEGAKPYWRGTITALSYEFAR